MKGPRMLGLSRCLKYLGMGILAVCSIPAAAAEADIDIELNKMEPHEKDCRAYFVINNKGDKSYDTLKLDLVLFRSDGVIGQRFAVELAPIKPKKRTVKLFDISDTACDQVGSFLVNEVIECKATAGDVSDCLQELSVSSRTDVELAK